jgi:hypothetical protein
MHCAMHCDITAWKSQSAFSIRMSIHFDAVIMAVARQPPLCFIPSDFIDVIFISCGQELTLPQLAYSLYNF